MAGDHPCVFPAREAADDAETFHHGLGVVDDGEELSALKVLVEMRGVGGEADRADPRLHPHHLQPFRMPAGAVNRDPGRDLTVALVELNPA